MKAFLGMGLLGSNFVKAMLRKGENVQIWNRTTSKAIALESEGAKVFENITSAVKGADVIHLTLKDDDTVNEVLEAASPGFKSGATIIDHTTTSAKGAVERTAKWKARGFTYMHAPVFMGPSNALEGSGSMLVSGDQGVIRKVESELSKMTGKLINLGSEEGKAAGLKLIGNSFLIAMTAGLSDTLALAKAQGIPSANVAELFGSWNPGSGMPARLNKLIEGNFSSPSWELDMARKDAGLMMKAAEEGQTKLTVIPAIAKEMDSWIAKGHGSDDWSIIAKDNL
ncbi:NAD-binding protein [Pedobacter sp. LMG 31464]|uniref:NAD-binding protein n=1 Tax=Pedobacter planticolens TaxID=2679964 RepID=A0A923DXW8_9SPHI|nr:NAD(P)-dependent oxidoreductase [Pedobacter planticolens]MBB2144483.1 NAD-binding protein [Pedobacter planticolens]